MSFEYYFGDLLSKFWHLTVSVKRMKLHIFNLVGRETLDLFGNLLLLLCVRSVTWDLLVIARFHPGSFLFCYFV